MRTLFTIFLYLLLGATTVCAQPYQCLKGEYFDPRDRWQEVSVIGQERSRILGHKREVLWCWEYYEFVEPQRFIALAKEYSQTAYAKALSRVLNRQVAGQRVRPQLHFATTSEAEEFLRTNYSFYATAYPDDHAEIVRRFVALLDKQLTLTRAERKFLERKSKEIASVAGVFDPTLRRAEFKRLLSLSFSKERLRSAVVALMVDDESLRRAEQRYIYDTYSGCYKEHYTHQKAAAIYLIYGKKVLIPQYPTPTLVSASEELCGY